MSIETQITEKISDAIQPIHLEVINESHMHNVPKDSESHFKLLVVAEAFFKIKTGFKDTEPLTAYSLMN